MGPDKVASISWQARDIWTPFSCWNEIKYFLCQLRIRRRIVFEDNSAASENTNPIMCSVLAVSLLLFQCWLLAAFVLAWNTSRIKHKNISDFFKSTAGVGRRGIRCWLNWRSGCTPNAICSTQFQFQFSIQANCYNGTNFVPPALTWKVCLESGSSKGKALMNSFILILVLLDVIPEITFAICVFSRFQSNLLSDFRIKSHLQQIRPQFDSIIANIRSVSKNNQLWCKSLIIVTQVKKLRCHDYNCLCKACLVGRLNYISVKSAHFEQRKRTGGKIQMFSIQVRQHWNREDATFCPLFIPICRFYSTEGEQLHDEGNDKNRISAAIYIRC